MVFDEMLEKEAGIEILNLMAPKLMQWREDAKEKKLTFTKVELLSKKIEALPIEGQSLLFGNYVFDLNSESMEILYEINDPDMHLVFFEHLLSEIMGIQEGERISDISMEKACKKALWKIVNSSEKDYKKDILSYIIKTVAAVFLIGILSFGTVMSVNAEFREYIINWFIEVTEQYTLFNLESSNPVDPLEQNIYIPSYIPERYHIYRSDVLPGFISYTYEDENQDVLNISISEPDTNAYLNTENMTKEKITINGASGYLYHDGIYGSLVTNIDEYALYVTGKASKEEFIKIAEGVKK